MKRIHVVAAVIRGVDHHEQEAILISKRPDHVHQGGKWEFPGGKVESDETVESSLIRELQEELGITPTKYSPLIQIHHDYPDKSVFLDVWEVQAFSGEPHGAEGQLIEWVDAERLNEFEFPAANVPIVNAAMLPSLYWITPEPDKSSAEFLSLIEQRLKLGVKLIQFRVKQEFSSVNLKELSQQVSALCKQFKADLFVNSFTLQCCLNPIVDEGVDAMNSEEIRARFQGIHLTSSHLQQQGENEIRNSIVALELPLSASCHDQEELNRAEELGCRFATLSPINSTESHPDVELLDLDSALTWVKQAKLPVYGLGGMKPSQVDQFKQLGFQGVAGIRLCDREQ
ncbi:MAG: Nudix family hydrolase [Pseudomonadales bacterium]|nr:Nudix family hydrolase [Pseudomonadales bacterium]